MKNKINGMAIGCVAGIFAATVGCSKSSDVRKEARSDQSSAQYSGEQKIPENEEQVVSERTTPVQSNMGGTAKRGEGDVQAQREVVTKKTETLDEKVPTIVTGQQKLDVNRMKAEDFAALGLDRGSAESIVKFRNEHGLFHSANDLSAIEGVNPDWLRKYSSRFAFVDEKGNNLQQAGQAGQ